MTTAPSSPTETPPERRRWRPGLSPRDIVVRWGLTLAILALLGALLLENRDELTQVLTELSDVSVAAAIALVLLLLLMRVLVGAQMAFAIPGLGITRAFVASEASAAASNVIPGPSGTATKLLVLNSWGYRVEEFARSWLLTSALTNLTVLAGPAIAAIVLAVRFQHVGGGMLIIGAVGLVASVVGIVVVAAIVRSERMARRCGRLGGRAMRWWNGFRKREPGETDFEEVTLAFRTDIIESWHARGGRISLAVAGAYLLSGLLLVLSVRAVGLGESVLPVASVLAVYTAVRLLTVVNITPGGAGVTEALYISGLMIAAPDADQPTVVAAVVLFRGLTYAGPIVLGGISLVVWRMRRSWRRAIPVEDAATVAVGGAMAGQEVERPG